MRTLIDPALLETILATADATPGREVCGLMFGSPERITTAIAVANVALDSCRSFEIDPAALFAALKAQRSGGPHLIGHYHSHPSGSAEPSAADIAAAEPGKLWLIVGAGTARLWLAGENGFDEVEMTPTAEAGLRLR